MEFFDRHRKLPIVLLFLLPFVVQVPFWLLRLSTDPFWFFSQITQSSYKGRGSPFLDPNAGFTSEALGHLAAWDWLHGVIPWWNPYTGIGVPLAGELQPGAFFLPFNLLLLLPEGVLWQRIAMQIIAGLATYALLRELRISRLAALLGGSLFALNGVIAWTPGPVAVYCSTPFLPCLLWGIERARRPQQGALSILAVGLAIAWSILAGFPEPAYIGGLLALAWGLYRLASEPARWAMARRALGGLCLGLLVTSPLLIAFVDYLLQSDSFAVHKVSGVSLPWEALPATVMPYVYGPLNFLLTSELLVSLWGRIGGYTGVMVLVMAAVGVTRGAADDRGLKRLLITWVLLCWARTFGVQPVTFIVNHLPLLSQNQFYRYGDASWILALTILAAYGLDEFRQTTPRRRHIFGVVALLLIVSTAIAWPLRASWGWSRGNALVMFVWLGLGIFWAVAGLGGLGLAWRIPGRESRRTALASVLVFDAAVMFMAAEVSAARHNRIDVQAIRFLQDHQGLLRTYTLEPLAPNYGAYFRVASIDHNILPVPRLWAEYVDRYLLPGLQKNSDGVIFWPWSYAGGVAERTFSNNLGKFRNVGVRYILTRPGQSALPPSYLVASDSELRVRPEKKVRVSESPVLAWSRSVAGDPSKPEAKRLVASAVVRLLTRAQASMRDSSTIAGADRGPTGSQVENRAAHQQDLLILQNGQSAQIVVAMPAAFAASAIDEVGVLVRNDILPADGELAVKICTETVCRSGLEPFSDSHSREFSEVQLDQPLAAAPGTALHLTFTYRGGSRPMALAIAVGANQQLQGPDRALPGSGLHVLFEDSMTLRGFQKVYEDSEMDIWEVPDPAPYYEVTVGGPCTLAPEQREEITARCSSPATLRRRELYMPGWEVTRNRAAAGAVRQDGIFQAVALPAGLSAVNYRFTPPHMAIGWAACLTGLVGLFWQVVRIGRGRRDDSDVIPKEPT